MKSLDYANELKADILSGKKFTELELDQRLTTIIQSAQIERASEINNAMFPDAIGVAITEPESIKPEDMVKGEWYFIKSINNNDYIFKFKEIEIDNNHITYELCFDFFADRKTNLKWLCHLDQIGELRRATRDEVIKYFPQEFDRQPEYGC